MFEDLGESIAAVKLNQSVKSLLAYEDAPRTPDLNGEAGTEEVISALRQRI